MHRYRLSGCPLGVGHRQTRLHLMQVRYYDTRLDGMPLFYSQPEALELATWAQALKPSSIQRLLDLTTRPEIISLALGKPAAELFPVEAFARAATSVLEHDRSALQY